MGKFQQVSFFYDSWHTTPDNLMQFSTVLSKIHIHNLTSVIQFQVSIYVEIFRYLVL